MNEIWSKQFAPVAKWVLIIVLLWFALVFMPQGVWDQISKIVDKMTSEQINKIK